MAEKVLLVNLRVQPSAKRDEISGWMEDGTLKVKVRGKPLEGKANESLLMLFSKALDIPKRDITIVAGEKSRNKRLKFFGIDKDVIDQYLKNQGN